MNYEPWDESHAPKRFERKDNSGMWNPIVDEDRFIEPGWISWAGGMALGVLFALLLVHWMMAW